MIDSSPLSEECLSALITVTARDNALRVVTHEGIQKEFKETFTWGSLGLYARTMAAFANARGGYMIFGISDKPRILKGLTEAAQISFDELDRAKLTNSLNEIFSPEILWDSKSYQVQGQAIGVIYVYENDNKPVIARKAFQGSNAKLLEGDVLYRYNSRTERAKFPELKRIIDDAKSREQRAMMRHIEELIRAGASNAAILDFKSSSIKGPTGERVLVSQDLLDQVSFIKDGEFRETEGSPTLRVVGNVVPTNMINLGTERVIHHAITTEDLIADFLNQSPGSEPRQYIRQAASGSTAFVPIHFYRVAAEMSTAQLVDYVNDINTRSQAKAKLLQRLHSADQMQMSVPSSSTQHISTIRRRGYYESLSIGHLPTLPIAETDEAKSFLDAIRALDDSQILGMYESLLEAVKSCFETHYEAAGKFADSIRRAACRIDYVLYGTDGSVLR